LRGRGCSKCYDERRRVSFFEFVERARAAHGDLYGYDSSDSVDVTTKVEITCGDPEHGAFRQIPMAHMNGQGCPKCAFPVRDTASFIWAATKRHGGKYDYSQTIFTGAREHLTIICPMDDHGPFQQTPNNHVRGKGCPDCSGNRKSTTQRFIAKARLLHGDRYGYDHVVYVNSGTDVLITCPRHREFPQTPDTHLAGCGCKKCGLGFVDTAMFRERATAIHQGKYDYSHCEITDGVSTIVTIGCPVHGVFDQLASRHLRGSGCYDCAIEAKRSNNEEFIAKAKKIHGDDYDYELVDYVTSTTDVEIVCKVHGPFPQKPSNHLSGAGCPTCSQSRGEREVRQWLSHRGVAFEPQWQVPEVYSRKNTPLKCDFMLPGLRVIVEYDGLQHFAPVKWKVSMTDEEAEANFLEIVKRDAFKNNWAEANDYLMIRIRFDEDVGGVLRERLLPLLRDAGELDGELDGGAPELSGLPLWDFIR
jgi:hypothetical protein